MFLPRPDRAVHRVRLHPNVLAPDTLGPDPRRLLLCRLAQEVTSSAGTSAGPPTSSLTRIAVTDPILLSAQDRELARIPTGAAPFVVRRWNAIRNVFTALGRIDDAPILWEDRLTLPGPGDQETVAALLQYGDHWIVSDQPASLPLALLAMLGVQIVTFEGMLRHAELQIPALLIDTLRAQPPALAIGPQAYERYLRAWGFGFLIQFMQGVGW